MSELIFSFLGPVQFSHPQIGEITITKRKALALLTYLVIEVDHPHTRESLLGLFWPEHSTAAAQNNLRVTCSQLQKFLEKAQEDDQPYLISNRSISLESPGLFLKTLNMDIRISLSFSKSLIKPRGSRIVYKKNNNDLKISWKSQLCEYLRLWIYSV
jgi:hypothetical protein